MNKTCVYTVITDDYDKLFVPLSSSKNIDYICFSDKPIKNSGCWQVILMKDGGKDKRLWQRRFKIFNPYIFEKYEKSIYIDGNIQIRCDLDKINLDFEEDIIFLSHDRDCLYEEAIACIKVGKDDKHTIISQIEHYKKNGYERNKGLYATGLIIRKHSPLIYSMCEEWFFNNVAKFSIRDQISLPYVLNKYPKLKIGVLPFSTINSLFKKVPHLK